MSEIDNLQESAPGTAVGKGKTLDEALDNAWGRVHQPDPQKYYPIDIAVRGANPINEYRVTIRTT
jgi:hypothetical protein